MKILHISSYYIGSKLYKNLFAKLADRGMDQVVFVPVRKVEHQGVNALSKDYTTVEYHYPNIIKKYHKVLYFRKIKKQHRVLEEKVALEDIGIMHAHTIFSDGGTAYRIHQQYGIPYVVSVRGTDIHHFYKKGIHLRPFMYRVLKEAKTVIFLSPAYKKYLLSRLPEKIRDEVGEKSVVIPNGIEEHWMVHPPAPKTLSKTGGAWIFIGLLNERKNVKSILEALARFHREGKPMKLHLIGTGPEEEDLKKRCRELDISNFVEFHGFIDDPEKIREMMAKSSLFIMPSHRETFGLVYGEALSQGLPVIYTRGQGFDGFFEEGEVGYPVNSRDVDSIVEGVRNVLQHYGKLTEKAAEKAEVFSWDRVADRITSIYGKEAGLRE